MDQTMKLTSEKERNSNIELLRIVSMMGVVALHYVNGSIGGIEQYAAFPNFTWMFVNAVRSMAIPLVNVFVLITGYYMVSRESFSYRKPADLMMTVLFYGMMRSFFSMAEGSFTFSGMMRNLFPIFYGSDWFIQTYLILYLLSPFVNKCLKTLRYSSHRLLLITQICLFSIWSSVGFNAPLKDRGYGIINFITLYMLGAFIRLHLEHCRFLAGIKVFSCFMIFGFCACLTFLSGIFINPFGYDFITNVCGAAGLFTAFIKMKHRSSRVVNRLGSKAFDVFFVHGKGLFQLLGIGMVPHTILLIPHILFTAAGCYLFGFICGCIRKYVFDRSVNIVISRTECLNRIIEI